MSDRLTQLQTALDQLATQFYASISYIIAHPNSSQSEMKELSHDLILKEAQIEYLISVLPGIGSSEKRQVDRLKELETELKLAEKERAEAGKVLEEVRGKLDGVIGKVQR